MPHRPIKRLSVRASIRQVDAQEACGLRYFHFVIWTGGLGWLIVTELPPESREAAQILFIVMVLATLMIFRPWHRGIHVDVDAAACRTELRLFGFLPIHRRSHDLGERWLAVEHRSHTEEKVEEDPGLGCLMMALPFPFSLLTFLLGGNRKGVVKYTAWWALCLRDWKWDRAEDLLVVATPEVAAPFLEAVRDILPRNVEPRSEESPEGDLK